MLLAALSLALLLAGARACPPSCSCGELWDGKQELDCDLPAGNVRIEAALQDSIEIFCTDDHIKCAELPEYPLSRNGSIFRLTLNDCTLDGPLACWLGRFGVNRVNAITFKGVKSELRPEHVEGLVGVRQLMMFYSDIQHTIPSEALALLPDLRHFRLREAAVSAPRPLNNLNLTYLELSNDNIEQLSEGAFQLNNLEQLLIFDNKIKNISKDHFKGLDSLKYLDISRNAIGSLPPGVFSHVQHLTRLLLGVNAIEDVHSEAFQGLKELKKIEAFNNAVTMRLSPHCLSNLPSLEVIELKNCKIPSLPPDLLLNSTKLINITITGNDIKELPEGLFRDQQLVTHLDLSGNKIAKVFNNESWSLDSLEVLNLDDNLIEVLSGDLFTGLSSLKVLCVNNNRLRFISPSALTHTFKLTDVYLANNLLTLQEPWLTNGSEPEMYSEPSQSPFRTLFKLETLDLSGNRISVIFDDWRFLLQNTMLLLNLSGNAFRDLTDADIQFLYNRKDSIIDLRHNKISSISLSNSLGFTADELSTDTLQSTILLDGNPFVCDCTNQNFFLKLHDKFPYYSQTPKLHIGNAKCVAPSSLKDKLIKDLDPSILTCPLKSNECPDTCTCDIRPSNKKLVVNCSSLKESLPNPINYGMIATDLIVSGELPTVDLPSHVDSLVLANIHLEHPISIPSTVHYVDLTNTGLEEIPTQLLKRNMTMKLSGNPFICDCSHDEDIQILKDNRFKVADNGTVRCMDGQTPWQIDVPRLCSVRRAALLGGSLAVFSVILIILAGLYYRYSTQIKIYIYSCEKLRWLIAEEDIDSDKKYDAFISFSHKDEKFVAEKLIPVLESGSRPFKLCVHYRDWIVGEWIPAQIVNSVEQSRRTIIVLSKSFVESVWGTMEFRVAYKRAQEEKRNRVVVILLEDAPPSGELDAELRAYLSTNTYVKWGDPWFWEKLRYALAGGRVGTVEKQKEKTPKGGLNAYLNSNGQIVNHSKDTLSTQISIS